jgi:hypothetical protein
MKKGKLINSRPKFIFNPAIKRRIPIGMSSGFPDFIAFRKNTKIHDIELPSYNVTGVECKMDGRLDKEEKEKCKWLIDNKIFSKILVARKGLKRGEILYREWNMKK